MLLCGALAFSWTSIGFDGGIKGGGMWLSSGSVIASVTMPPVGTEDRASARMLA